MCSAQNPYRQDASAATRAGTLATEKAWIRGHFDQAYLWPDEVPAVDAGLPAYSQDTASGFYSSIEAYFDALRVTRRDRFSFTYPTKAWQTLVQSGVSASVGLDMHMASPTPPRGLRVAQVDEASPAAEAGLQRGDTLVSVDGFGADTRDPAGVAALNAALFQTDGAPHRLVFSRAGQNLPPVTLQAREITRNPVPVTDVLVKGTSRVGYLLFNDHDAPSEARLITAISRLRDAAVQDLVLDLRYNGGGLLYVASELASMIAGPQRTAGQTFMKLRYNAKRTTDNARAPIPFYTASTEDVTLPTLNLGRVFVLTSAGTCSASEAIINGLEGVGVQVVRLGGTTCGKPYGFVGKDNCGISYFAIEFEGVNAKGFGDYASGFTPTCRVADDLDHVLGDPAEAQLKAALTWVDTGACPAGTRSLDGAGKPREAHGVWREPARTNAYGGGRP